MTASTPETDEPPPPHEAVVAANVRRLREAAGISQAELAARATAAGSDLGEMAVWGIEKSRRRIRVEDVYALAEVLGVTAPALLEPDAGPGPCTLLYEIAFEGSVVPVEADSHEMSDGWVRLYLRGELVYFAPPARLLGVRIRRDGEES